MNDVLLLAFIERCVERGLNGFDHADIYAGGRCEAHFGAALSQAPGLRQRLQIIGKADIVPAGQDCSRWRVKHYDSSARYLRQAVDVRLPRPVVAPLDGVVKQPEDAVAVVLIILGGVDASLSGDAVGTARAVLDTEATHMVAQFSQSRRCRRAGQPRADHNHLELALVGRIDQLHLLTVLVPLLFDGT